MGISCMTQATQIRALWQPRGGMGREVGGRVKREGTHVYLWPIHVDVWQRPTQFFKAIMLQLKSKLEKDALSMFYLFLKFSFIFNWRIVTLQYGDGFYHTSTWIGHRHTHVPSLLNLPPTSLPIPPPLGRHRAPALGSLYA